MIKLKIYGSRDIINWSWRMTGFNCIISEIFFSRHCENILFRRLILGVNIILYLIEIRAYQTIFYIYNDLHMLWMNLSDLEKATCLVFLKLDKVTLPYLFKLVSYLLGSGLGFYMLDWRNESIGLLPIIIAFGDALNLDND